MDYISKLHNLENKVVALTGGAGVLASEMAKGFLQANAKVVLLDLNEENLDKRVNELSHINPEVVGFKCNVLDEAILNDVKQKIMNKHGRLDVLINAAGGNMTSATIGIGQTIFDLKIDDEFFLQLLLSFL